MDLHTWIEADEQLLLALNGSHSLFWDGFMWVATSTLTWIPAALMLLYVILKNNPWRQGVVMVLMLALAIVAADQFASGFCKHYFMRFRPTQDPHLMYLVHTVNGYRGGLYGFISSHAANTFAVATFLSLVVRNRWFTCMMFLWALVPSYSRIYLGVHYPGDILGGMLAGCLVGWGIYRLYVWLCRRFFSQGRYVSDQYTVAGYELADLHALYCVLLLTYFYLFVGGMLAVSRLHL